MAVHRIRRGLDLPIAGAPRAEITDVASPRRVAVVAADYPGTKPRFVVQVGDQVKRAQPLFEDRTKPGVFLTSPGAGEVVAINRGAKRAFQSVVIELNERERKGETTDEDHQPLESWEIGHPEEANAEQIRSLLLESGLWSAFRARPFSKVPTPDSEPAAIFVTAMDTHPLGPSVERIVTQRSECFELGLSLVSKLTAGRTYLCRSPGSRVNAGESGVSVQEFKGRHPAGLPGLHIHLLEPVSRNRTVWQIGAQDVIAIAELFTKGKLEVERVVSLAGPAVKSPRLVRTRLGASLDDLVSDELMVGDIRVVSGSLLGGREAAGDVHGFLGRYHTQVSCLREGKRRRLFGWMRPGFDRFSSIPAFASCLLPGRKLDLDTDQNGEPRPMVPIGMYERVMPMDIMAPFLLRALAVKDTERAEKLGALELAEEDLALCSLVCPGKTDWGAALRENLNLIEKEG